MELSNAPCGVSTPPASSSLALVAGDPVRQRGAVLDDAGGEMRHHGTPRVREAARGGDHVVDGSPLDMGDVDARAGGQKVAEILDLLGGARHHLDRVAAQERLHLRGGAGVRRGRRFTLGEVQKTHHGLP
jgi:hypothetical protein